MYFNSVHGKNIQLSSDSSQARRVTGFCQGITFSNNPMTPLQRITFLVGSTNHSVNLANNKNSLTAGGGTVGKRGTMNAANSNSTLLSSKKSMWNGNLRIGLTTKNPVTLTTSDLPDFSYPTLLNTDCFWITCIKSSYLKHGNKLSLVLDEKNSLQLAVNYVVKATLFNGIIPNTPNIKLWLLLDIYGATNVVQFLASDDTPYEIKQRGLDAVNNFHSACLIGGSRSIYKTRLFVLGQDESGKSSLKQALIKSKTNGGKGRNKKQTKQLDLSASFRVKIDYQSNSWIVKPVINGEYKALAAEQHRRHHQQHGGSKRHSLSQNTGLLSPRSNLDKKKSISDTSLLEDAIIQKRKRSTSTSYLNEEDDYDNNFCSKEDLRTFRRQLSLEDNLDKTMKREENGGEEGKEPGGEEANEVKRDENLRPRSGGADSSGSSRESSDTEYDSDTNDALYAIDEYDESINTMDCDPAELKKDPTGFHYKRIAYNVYQELFTTKLFDKLWPSSSPNTSSNTASSNLMSNNFSESFFEKLALVEFETSVYNQLKSSKILYTYYEQIVYNEMKLMKTKPANTIMVNPAKSNSASIDSLTTAGLNGTNQVNENNLLSSEIKNIKSTRKKLSFTIQDLDDRTYQIFLSTRAVYLICFDLTQDLNGLAQTNFFYGFEKNGELTNLDYLDFIFKSIHFHTAIIPETAAVSTSNYDTVQIDEGGDAEPVKQTGGEHVNYERSSSISVDFKYSLLSPPIIIVGTNKNGLNHLSNKDDIIRHKFQKIREFLANKIYSNHVVEPYFAINNVTLNSTQSAEEKSGSAEENQEPSAEYLEDFYEIEKLKRVIEAVSLNQPYMGEQLPLKWMKFEQSLEKLKNKGFFYASLSQICEIAHEKDIKTQEELTTCLNFLNDLGAIIYYGNANDIFLRNTIILRPQKLVEIFSMILDAKMPSYLSKIQNDLNDSANGSSFNSSSNHSANLKWLNAWDKFNKRGILNDSLLDVLWKSVINQKPGLLGLMKKFDFICDSSSIPVTSGVKALMVAASENTLVAEREYLVPSRAKISYDQDFEEEMSRLKLNEKNAKKKYYCDSDYEDYDSDNEVEDLGGDKKKSNMFNGQMMGHAGGNTGGENSISIVEFYYDFCGYLPETLFHRIVTRIARWTLMKTGTDTANAVRMYYRKARFYLDENHDFTIEMAPIKYARIKIQIIRLSKIVHGYLSGDLPPEPNSCAKVRNFMESTLIDLRNLWIKRLMFNACVLCSCDKLCDLHQLKMCTHFKCMHFLNLDECLTNNIVTCEYRRVKTLIYKSWFPTQNISLHKGPILTATKTYSDKNMFYDEKTLPSWVKNVAKLLQVSGKESNKDKDKEKEPQIVTVHNENDWVALARLLGYNKSKISYFSESENPALQLICDWIMSSDNTNLTIEFLINYLEQLKRDDVIKIINNEREKETVNSSVFLSYQWDFQEEVLKIKENLEKAGFKCFMDVGQMGGGNMLYQKIDQAIRNAKVVIACVTPKFVVSHYCNREMALADLLRKPIVPIMLAPTPWPPPGGMGLIFSQLVYVDYFGVGGHGGVGRNADREQRNNEIVALVARHVDPSSYFLMNIDRMTDNEQNNQKNGGKQGKTSIFKSLMRGTSYYNGNNNGNANQTVAGGFIDEVHVNGANMNRRDTIRGVNNQARLSIIGGPGGGVALGANVNPSSRDNTADVPRCAVCSIL